MVALRGQVVVELSVGAVIVGRLRCAVAVRVTFIGGQTLQTGAGFAITQQLAPRRAGALEAAGGVDALVGTGLRVPFTLIYVCPQHKERPAPAEDRRQRVIEK